MAPTLRVLGPRPARCLAFVPFADRGAGQLLEELYGREGIEEIRAVKRALDPRWTLASGVLFPPT